MKYCEVKQFAQKLRNNPTPHEEILWKRLKNRQIEGFKFLRQHPVLTDRQGNDLNFLIPDFYCPKARLVIEVDGKIHEKNIEYDEWRQKIIESLNIRVIRFKNEELGNLEDVINRIRQLLLFLPTPTPPYSKGGARGG